MATPAQIQANQLNAQKSTGPKTEEGKARCKMNALKHGFHAQDFAVHPDDEPAFREFVDQMTQDLAPRNRLELTLAEKIIIDSWRLQRGATYETQALRALQTRDLARPVGELLFCGWNRDTHQQILAASRAELTLERAIWRRMRQLQELQQKPIVESPNKIDWPEEPPKIDDVEALLAHVDKERSRAEALAQREKQLRNLHRALQEAVSDCDSFDDEIYQLKRTPPSPRRDARLARLKKERFRANQTLAHVHKAINSVAAAAGTVTSDEDKQVKLILRAASTQRKETSELAAKQQLEHSHEVVVGLLDKFERAAPELCEAAKEKKRQQDEKRKLAQAKKSTKAKEIKIAGTDPIHQSTPSETPRLETRDLIPSAAQTPTPDAQDLTSSETPRPETQDLTPSEAPALSAREQRQGEIAALTEKEQYGLQRLRVYQKRIYELRKQPASREREREIYKNHTFINAVLAVEQLSRVPKHLLELNPEVDLEETAEEGPSIEANTANSRIML